MKPAFIFSIILLSISLEKASACSCGKYVVDPSSAIEEVVRKEFSADDVFDIEPEKDIVMTKAYLTGFERRNADFLRGSSCELKGPRGETLDYCSPKRKAEFEVKITSKNCSVFVKAKYNTKKATAKVLRSTCR